MSIRKREWKSPNGEAREAWVVDYVDAGGKRRLKTFKRKRDADDYNTKIATELRDGTHVADRASITVAEAGKLWLVTCEQHNLEPSSIERNRLHVRRHINPRLGALRLSALTVPKVIEFEDALTARGLAPATVRGILVSLHGVLAEAQLRGLVAQNVVRARGRRPRKSAVRAKLKIGVDIPSLDEIKRLLPHLHGPHRALLMTAIFTGLRASELRGLRWADVDLKKGELHVRQRADKWNTIGEPKSAAGTRAVPLPPQLVSLLREWKLACPKGPLGLAFPNSAGKVDELRQIVKHSLHPAMIAAGLITAHGKPKYRGMHALRHAYASWCINRKADGGLELPLKVVQARLGHSSIAMTADVYGHLFARGDDGKELADAAEALLA